MGTQRYSPRSKKQTEFVFFTKNGKGATWSSPLFHRRLYLCRIPVPYIFMAMSTPFFTHFLLIALLLTSPPSAFAQRTPPQRPNIIYIYADDLGYGELGCYGQKVIRTPHLDQMAREGIRFTQHYSGAPVCAPSRCMLMTGKHAGHSYIRGNYELGGFPDSLERGQMPLPEGIYTLPALLQKAGYRTGLCGKWGLGMHDNSGSPLLHGFDYYFGYLDQKQAHNFYPTHLWENDQLVPLRNPPFEVHRPLNPATATEADFQSFIGTDYAPALLTEKAVAFIKKNKDKPFFLYLPYPLPHVSLQVPAPYVDHYRGQLEEQPYYGQAGYASCRYPRSTYAGMISFLDDQVGVILRVLQELGLDNNTLVCFSSDNGASFAGGVDTRFFESMAGLRGHKMDLYEGGIRVPFIARWPGTIPPGQTTAHISAQYDVMATLAELTGQSAGKTDGISFLPTLLARAQGQTIHPFLYFEFSEKGGQLAIRMGPWKGVRSQLKTQSDAPWELYHLEKDPSEAHNVAGEYPAILEEIERIRKQARQKAHVLDWELKGY